MVFQCSTLARIPGISDLNRWPLSGRRADDLFTATSSLNSASPPSMARPHSCQFLLDLQLTRQRGAAWRVLPRKDANRCRSSSIATLSFHAPTGPVGPVGRGTQLQSSRTPIELFDPASISATPFLGHGFGIIPAPGSFASSAFPAPRRKFGTSEFPGPSRNAAARLGSSIHSPLGAPRKWGRKWRNKTCISITFNL